MVVAGCLGQRATHPDVLPRARVATVTGREMRTRVPRSRSAHAAIKFSLNADGAAKFARATGENVGHQLAIILDNTDVGAVHPRTDRAARPTSPARSRSRRRWTCRWCWSGAARVADVSRRRPSAPHSVNSPSARALWPARRPGPGDDLHAHQSWPASTRSSGHDESDHPDGFMSYLVAMTLPESPFILTIGMGVDSNVLIFEHPRRTGGQERRAAGVAADSIACSDHRRHARGIADCRRVPVPVRHGADSRVRDHAGVWSHQQRVHRRFRFAHAVRVDSLEPARGIGTETQHLTAGA